MNLKEAEKYIRSELNGIYGDGESAAVARLVLEDCTGFSPTALSLKKDEDLSTEQQAKLKQDLERLLRHEPIQYVMQKAWFYGLELYVDKSVLIPRPETEELVDWIVNDLKAAGKDVFQKGATDADQTTQLKILDIGTGSGCIALALKKAMPKAEVWGCDVSEEALNVARRNGAALDIRVDFQGVNFLDQARQTFLPTVDVIVSNPPYIPVNQKKAMASNVLDHEPHTALFVPDNNALLFYSAIARFGKKRLHEGGTVYVEIHEDLREAVADLFRREGYQKIDARRDMQGKDRMIKCAAKPG